MYKTRSILVVPHANVCMEHHSAGNNTYLVQGLGWSVEEVVYIVTGAERVFMSQKCGGLLEDCSEPVLRMPVACACML